MRYVDHVVQCRASSQGSKQSLRTDALLDLDNSRYYNIAHVLYLNVVLDSHTHTHMLVECCNQILSINHDNKCCGCALIRTAPTCFTNLYSMLVMSVVNRALL